MKHHSQIRRLLWSTFKSAVFGAALTAGLAMTNVVQAQDLVLNGDAKCTKCHDAEAGANVLAISKTKHGVRADSRTPTCTSCHGASENHLANKGKAAPDAVFKKGSFTASNAKTLNESCLSCHDTDSKRHLWTGSAHDAANVACASCHQVHVAHDKVRDKATQPEVCFTCHKTQRADSHKLSKHPVAAGKMACSDCHNVHGSNGPNLLVKNSVNETCFTCHAEKRGPFLWEHQPATDDCTTCHVTHGSNTPALLKSRPPFLCQECHQDHGAGLKDGSGVVNAAGSPAVNAQIAGASIGKFLSVQANGRKCVACHVMVHGSNHPAGAALTR